jgi:hypothetical protein
MYETIRGVNERVEQLARVFDRGLAKTKAAPKNTVMMKTQGLQHEEEPPAVIQGTMIASGTAPRTQSPDDAEKSRVRNPKGVMTDVDMIDAEVSAYKQTRAIYTQKIMLSG